MAHLPDVEAGDLPKIRARVTDSHLALAPHYLVRVAGMPLTKLSPLRFGETAMLTSRIIECEEWLKSNRDRLCDGLFHAARGVANQSLRKELIQLKRDIFNLRPIHLSEVECFKTIVSPDVWEILFAWTERVVERAEAIERGPALIESEMLEKRRILRDLVQSEELHNALSVSNPGFPEQVRKYLQAPPGRITKQERQTELTLCLYLSRMAARTTPLARFAAVGCGFLNRGNSLLRAQFSDQKRSSHFQINLALIQGIGEILSQNEQIRSYLKPRVNPTLTGEAGKMQWIRTRYYRRRSKKWLYWDSDQSFASLPASETLGDILDQVGLCRDYDDLLPRIDADRSKAVETVRRLEDMGLIEFRIPIADLSCDHLSELAAVLATIPVELAQQTSSRLSSIRELLEQCRCADSAGRPVYIQSARIAIKQLCDAVEMPVDADWKRLFYEDVAIDFDTLDLSGLGLERISGVLTLWARFLSLLDVSAFQKTLATSFFLQKFGADARVSVIRFYKEYLRMFHVGLREMMEAKEDEDERLPFWHETGFAPVSALDDLQQLYRVQREAIDFLHTQMQGGDADEVVLDAERLKSFLSQVDLPFEPRAGVAFTCSFSNSATGPVLIVRQLLPGNGKAFARFTHASSALGPEAAEELRDSVTQTLCRAGGNSLVVDLGGIFGFNVNLRGRLTDYLLEYPGTTPFRGARTLRLSDLRIGYDSNAGSLALVSEDLDRVVVPVDLGWMLFTRVPPLYQFLSETSPFGNHPISAQNINPTEERKPVRRFPQLRMENVILSPRRWVFEDAGLPPSDSKQLSDFEFFVETARWRKQHGLPEQVFMSRGIYALKRKFNDNVRKAYRPDEPAGDSLAGDRDRDDVGVPMFVDFSNQLMVKTFRRTISHGGPISISEALLNTENLVASSESGRYAADVVLEVVHHDTVRAG